MRWVMVNITPLLNIAGLVFDIVGAFFVASEIVHQFRGRQHRDSFSFDSEVVFGPVPTDEYKRWEHLKTRDMKIGLFCLGVGFLLQIVANVLQLKFAL